jgi:Escherichia/Staphylococcus phage prohead protease
MGMIEHRAATTLLGVGVAESPASSKIGSGFRVGGTALPYEPSPGATANIGGEFLEMWSPTALQRQAQNGWSYLDGGAGVELRFAHEENSLLASTRSGTLQLENGPLALTFRADVPPSPYLRHLIESGDLAGASVGFIALDQQWLPAAEADGMATRLITEAALVELSLVAAPAFPGATAGIGRSQQNRAGRRLSAASRDAIHVAISHVLAGQHDLAVERLRGLLAGLDADQEGEESLLGDAQAGRSRTPYATNTLSLKATERQLAERERKRRAEAMHRFQHNELVQGQVHADAMARSARRAMSRR